MPLGMFQGSNPLPGIGAFSSYNFDPVTRSAVQYINAIAAFSEFGARFPYNEATTTSLTTAGGETLTARINRYDELIVNKPLIVTVSPCLIFARRISLAANPLLSAGPNSGGTFASSSALGSSNAWSSPSNAAASDDSRATASGDANPTQYLKATNFGFSIPTSAVIEGIKVEIERSSNQGGAPHWTDRAVKIVKGGTVCAGNFADTSTQWGSSDAYATYGGQSQKWGQDWTPADINNSGFGVVLSAITDGLGATARVDHIRITVYYYDGGMICADGNGVAGALGATGARPSGSKVNATAAGVGTGFPMTPNLASGGDTSGLANGASGAGGTTSGAGGDASAGGNGGAADDQNAGATGGAVGSAGVAAMSTIELADLMTLGRWTRWLYRWAKGPAAGAGGGGGGGSASTTAGRNGGDGGAGGNSGGQLWLMCEQWDNQGLVTCRGKTGHAADNSGVTNASDGSGGPGAGGNGGAIKVVTLESINDGTFDVSAGPAGPVSTLGVTATSSGAAGAGAAGISHLEKVT